MCKHLHVRERSVSTGQDVDIFAGCCSAGHPSPLSPASGSRDAPPPQHPSCIAHLSVSRTQRIRTFSQRKETIPITEGKGFPRPGKVSRVAKLGTVTECPEEDTLLTRILGHSPLLLGHVWNQPQAPA